MSWRAPQSIRLVPFVGLIVLLVRWAKEPRSGLHDEEQRLREHMALTEAWLVTLATLLGLVVLFMVVAFFVRT